MPPTNNRRPSFTGAVHVSFVSYCVQRSKTNGFGSWSELSLPSDRHELRQGPAPRFGVAIRTLTGLPRTYWPLSFCNASPASSSEWKLTKQYPGFRPLKGSIEMSMLLLIVVSYTAGSRNETAETDTAMWLSRKICCTSERCEAYGRHPTYNRR